MMLSACGGGGSGSGGSAPPASADVPPATVPTSAWPASGSYTVVLKASGSTSASTIALSLVHPSTPQVEYVIDSSFAPSNLGLTLYRGTYAATSQQFGAVSPVAYVDAPNGIVRTTLLSANGARPVQSTGPTHALCAGDIVASNYADPFATVIIANDAGADGVCGTADDDQVMIGFASSGEPHAQTTSGYVGFLRSAATGAPADWLVTDTSGAETALPIDSNANALVVGIGTPGVTSVVYAPIVNLSDTLLYSRNGALMGFGNGSGSLARMTLSSATGPDGWKSAGNDASYAYAYLNSATANSGIGTWRLVAVSRATLATSVLATGAGTVLAASAAPGAVYATVFTITGSRVAQIATPTGTQTSLWPSTSTVTAVSTNSSGLNSVFTAASGQEPGMALVDNQGNSLYAQGAGLVYGADGSAFDAASGDQVFAGAYVVGLSTGTYMGGMPLVRVDAATHASTSMGTLPTGADLGGAASEQVFVTPISAEPAFGGFFASRLSGTQLATTGGAVYTFDPTRANSLVRTTSQVR